MSLLTALYTGRSGIEANSADLSVIGDNIANANTVGFKASRSDFEEQLSESLLGAGGIGLGTNMQRVQQIVTQGSLTTTGNATDLALQGNGMFIVAGAANGQQGQFYTRNGEFSLNKDGFLVNQDGLRVQGYTADATGGIETQLGDLNLATTVAAPQATSNIAVKANLDSTASVPAKSPFDPTSSATAAASSNFNTSTTIYDSLGASHQATVYFSKLGAGAWSWNAVADGAGITGGVAGTPSVIGTGTLTFDSAGNLTAETQASTFSPIGATQPQALNFNFGTGTAAGGTGTDGITQYASARANGQGSAATFASQDGWAQGTLTGVNISTNGTVEGTFSNGQTKAVGQVAVANFQAPDRLVRMGGNLYMATPNDIRAGALGSASNGEGVNGFQTVTGSGDAVIGVAGTGGRGSITSGSLEQSNVDITNQFVGMITAQRDFEANSKTVTTADQMLSDLIQMKR